MDFALYFLHWTCIIKEIFVSSMDYFSLQTDNECFIKMWTYPLKHLLFSLNVQTLCLLSSNVFYMCAPSMCYQNCHWLISINCCFSNFQSVNLQPEWLLEVWWHHFWISQKHDSDKVSSYMIIDYPIYISMVDFLGRKRPRNKAVIIPLQAFVLPAEFVCVCGGQRLSLDGFSWAHQGH